MEKKLNLVGIIVENVLLSHCLKANLTRTALLGQIVMIDSTQENKYCILRFLKEGDGWETTSFKCPLKSVVFVDDRFWPFLSAVVSPKDRVKLAQNKTRISKLLQITTDVVVGFQCDDTVYLGTVKFIGNVKGIGKCFGIALHDKKANNPCDGSCGGIQYFHCLPGFGVFTTAEKISPQNSYLMNNDEEKTSSRNNHSDYDAFIKFNVERLSEKEPPTSSNTILKPKLKSILKASPSMQEIVHENSVNTNNDFDQNSILQPENLYLLYGTNSNTKSLSRGGSNGIELIETAGSWSTNGLDKSSKKYGDVNEDETSENNAGNLGFNGRLAKVKNVNSLVANGVNKTIPLRKQIMSNFSGFNSDKLPVRHSTTKFYVDDELNERLELATPMPSTSSSQTEDVHFLEPEPSETNDLVIGSMVEVLNDVSEEPLFGVIRWMGKERNSTYVVAGVELEDESVHLPLTLSDGTYKGKKLFDCVGERVLFVLVKQCRKDSRFQDGLPTPIQNGSERTFGKDCPIIPGAVPPLIMKTEQDVEAVCGKFRGIQGHINSCYLDATLFAMFTYTAVFDSLLFRPRQPNDIPEYEEVQRVLREEIVNPLRTNLFVRADRVMSLRKLLDRLGSVSGLMSEEKDPEEFLTTLLAQILKVEPFLKLNSGQESYLYQLFVEKDEKLLLPTVQQLFEQSFLTSSIKLKEVPSCLIVQMPRYGRNYKMYERILPSQLLDVTDIIDNSPRQCTVCGKLAQWECSDCYGQRGEGLESTAFCTACLEIAHKHGRQTHRPVNLNIPHDFAIIADRSPVPRLYMELFAVVCIETSHYVAFVKCGTGHEAPWCFFDSMADRKGESNGYNIPEMVACPDISKWLADEHVCRSLNETSSLELPEHARRLLCDAYICMYQSADVMMYS